MRADSRIAAGGVVVGLGLLGGALLLRRRAASSIPVALPDFGGSLGSELQRAKAEGWDLLFAKSERAHGLPAGILAAIASRETHMQDIVGDGGHGRGLMQIDDRGHGGWLKAHGAGDAGKPVVADAIDYAGQLVAEAIAYGRAHGVEEGDLMKFALSAYNAGGGGALKGYKNGDSDAGTTGHDYGADVLRRRREMFPSAGEPVLAPAATPQIAGIGGDALAPALSTLLRQIDELWPHRDTSSDSGLGGAGDHADGVAIDVTNDPSAGPDLRVLAETILGDPRAHYVVFDSRIASRDEAGGAWRPYPERLPDETESAFAARARGYNSHRRHLHISLRRSGKTNSSRWAGLDRAIRSTPQPGPASIERLPELLRRGIVDLWRHQLVDNFRWVRLKVGEYEIDVTADCASAYGLRMPASFDDSLTMCGEVTNILPPTRAIVDARWKSASLRMVSPPKPIAPTRGYRILPAPLGDAKIANGKDPDGVRQVQTWDAALGRVSSGDLYDGGWKEWILEPGIAEGAAVNYGLRKDIAGAVWQSPGHHHDAKWLDYSQLVTFVHRRAKRNGAEVDLLEEIAHGCPLGGPLPGWIVDRLNGGSSS